MLVALDAAGQVRDLYYPYAGEELHTGDDCVHRIGVWVEGAFSWLSDPGWQIEVRYQHETLASDIHAYHAQLGIELTFLDVVYNERNIFLRRIFITNTRERRRSVRLFMGQQLVISESWRGNTAFYEPAMQAIIHHRGRRVFLVGGVMHGDPFQLYSVGHFNSHGKEGTWRDAEDGVLDGNPIEHGKVDSTIGFAATVAAGDTVVADYWLIAGETLPQVKREHSYLLAKTPDHLLESTQDYWRAWVGKYRYTFYNLAPQVVDLFKTSLLIMRTHVDQRGGIIASCDAAILKDGYDTYSYVWHRDAALITAAFTRAGYFEIARRFFEFSRDVISEEGYFYHKYTVSRSLGSSWHAWIRHGTRRLPIQEDETALTLWVLWQYYERTKNVEFIEELYNPLIKHAAEFLASYRHQDSKLPKSSYDLWEEKYGVTVFTTSATVAALRSAARFAELLGKEGDAARFAGAATEISDALLTHLVADEGDVRLFCHFGDERAPVDDTLDVSNLYGLITFDILPVTDPRIAAIRERVLRELSPEGTIGGVARHRDDHYYRSHQEVHGNPWFITTLWLAECDIRRAKSAEELQAVVPYFDWVAQYAQSSGVLSEQLDPYSGAQLSVAPLIWSHAQFVSTVILYLEKLEELGICTTCYPLKAR
jgi:GH15 family glucan-1,4-alpha-glucosidase